MVFRRRAGPGTMRPFADRRHAGRVLGQALLARGVHGGALVLGLPRGGVPVAFEVARALGSPFDAFLVRKLGVPGHEELAMGAVASGGVTVVSDAIVREAGVSAASLAIVVERERQELARREILYRDDRPAPAMRDREVILVDDGLATGASMQAAVEAVRSSRPSRIVVAVPVAPAESIAELRGAADDVVAAIRPTDFFSVGSWYEDFRQTTDDEVRDLLALAAAND